MAGGGAGAVEGGLTETLVWRSLHSSIGGEAMRQTRLSYSTETGTGPSCFRILGFADGGAQLDTSRSIAQPHRVLDLHNGASFCGELEMLGDSSVLLYDIKECADAYQIPIDDHFIRTTESFNSCMFDSLIHKSCKCYALNMFCLLSV